GYASPLYSPGADVDYGVVSNNIIWDRQGAATYEPLVKLLEERGLGRNIIADPMLIAPQQGDYRPAPSSPAVSPAAGALPVVPGDYHDSVAPELTVRVAAPASALTPITEVYRESDPWNGGQGPQ